MNSKHWVITGLACATLLGAVAPAGAQDKLDKDTFKRWGGTWMSDCANNKSARVTLFEDALVFLNGDNRVAASKLQAAASWFGNSPPEHYVMAFLSELPGEKQFLAIVWEDKQGEYITLDGDKSVMDQIGKLPATATYRLCATESAKKPTDAAKPAAPAAAAAGATPAAGAKPAVDEAPDAGALIANPAFKTAYYKALGRYRNQPWLTDLDGPAPASSKVTIAGVEYLVVSSCKNHDCFDNNTVIMYSAAKKLVYGKIHMAAKSAMIGNPPPAVAKELGAQWLRLFRSNP